MFQTSARASTDPEGYTCTNCGKFAKFTICQSDANGNRGRLMARVRDPLSLLLISLTSSYIVQGLKQGGRPMQFF